MGMEAIRETMDSCKHCFMCRHACPVFLATKLDSHTPRGYALMLAEIDAGKLEWSSSVVDRFYQCSQCGLCREDCAYHWAEDDLVRNGREEIVNSGAAPPRITETAERLVNNGVPLENVSTIPDVLKKKFMKKNPDVLYVAGWAARYERPEIVNAMAVILDRLGIDWSALENECCGIELLELGYAGEARRQAESFVKSVKALNPRRIVSSCPHVCRALREQYAGMGISFPPVPVLHVVEFLVEEVEAGRISPAAMKVDAAGYHDPCHLGRKLGVFDEPRRLVRLATGVAPLELFHSREAAECCGAGSVMFVTEPEIALKVARRRIESARQEGIKTLITACGNCKTLLLGAENAAENGIAVMDIAELVAAALRNHE